MNVSDTIKDTAEKYKDISAIGVTTFGETFVALDENNKALMSSMLYTDPRGMAEVCEPCEKLGEKKIISICGVKPHQMYSLPKIIWIKNNSPAEYKKIRRILLMEDFIIYMLTGKACINYSLAGRTMAFDMRSKCWSDKICKATGIDKNILSIPVPVGNIAGSILKDIADKLGLNADVKVINGCHDQAAEQRWRYGFK